MEAVTVDRWLFSKLTGDTTLMNLVTGVFSWPGVSLTYPCVVFQEQSPPRDVRGVGPSTYMVDGLWLVRGIVEANSYTGALETIANRTHTLLHAASGSVPTYGNVWVCVREQTFRLSEITSGRQFRHLGGIYRIYAK